MICVTLGRGRHRTMLEEWGQAAEAGAELVELRVDCLRSEINLKRLLADRKTPFVFTVRRGADGGLWRGNEEKRLLLLREAIVTGVDYVDLELDVAPSIPRFGKTKRIVSYHNFRETPGDLEAIVSQAREAHPDARFVIAGMRAPPNLGSRYAETFEAVYPEVAKAAGAALVPFLLAGVAGDPDLNQVDGIHPTAAGQRIIAETVWQALEPLLAPR